MTLVFADRIPEQLKDSLLHGKAAAEIQWGRDGAFRRCQTFLKAHGVPERMIDGECANLYHAANGRWPGAHKEHGLIAAAEVHTGAMIALIPTPEDAKRLAMDGGEPSEELHVTFCYLGDGNQWPLGDRLAMGAMVAKAIGNRPPMEGNAFSVAYFNPGDEDTETALVYGIGGEGPQYLRGQILAELDEAYQDRIPEQHKPWIPHITAAYTDDLDAHRGLVGNLGPVTFDRVRLAFGGDHYDIPLDVPAAVETEDAADVGVVSGRDGVSAGEVEIYPEVTVPGDHIDDVDMAALVAAMGVYAPVRWYGPLAPIGTPTGDKRIFAPGAIEQASFPQPLRWQERGMPGHQDAVVIGSITHAAEGTWKGEPHIFGAGIFLNPDIIPEVKKVLHLIENGVSGPSVDLDSFAANVGEYQGDPIMVVQRGRQRGATLVSIPAFADLRITLEYPRGVDESVDYALPAQVEAMDLVASGLGEWEAELTEFATVNSNSWQGAPIAPRDATFDADDAVSRIEAWAGIGTDAADEAKFRSMFMWINADSSVDEVTPLGRGGYRLPWGDIFDGKPHLVYHAIYSASALLEGGHGGLPNISDEDKNRLRNTITKIYAKLATEFGDPNIRASWDEAASSQGLETFDGRYTESKHPRDPGGKDGGEWVDVPGHGPHGEITKGGKKSSGGSDSGGGKDSGGSKESKSKESGGGFEARAKAANSGERVLSSAPAKLRRAEKGHAGQYGDESLDAPEGAGSARALAEMEGTEYQHTNSQLWSGNLSASTKERVAEVDKTMAVSKLPRDAVVYRGVKDGKAAFGPDWIAPGLHQMSFEDEDKAYERYAAGERPDLTGFQWTQKSYLHTTVSKERLEGYAKKIEGADMEPVAMTIVLPKGTGGVNMSGMDYEAELMAQRGLRLRVARDNGYIGGVRHLDIEVVGDGD